MFDTFVPSFVISASELVGEDGLTSFFLDYIDGIRYA